MFNNIGKKIMTLAKIMCWIGIAASVVTGIILAADDPLIGVIVIGGGFLVFWIGSWMLYAFGELTDNIAGIRRTVETPAAPAAARPAAGRPAAPAAARSAAPQDMNAELPDL